MSFQTPCFSLAFAAFDVADIRPFPSEEEGSANPLQHLCRMCFLFMPLAKKLPATILRMTLHALRGL